MKQQQKVKKRKEKTNKQTNKKGFKMPSTLLLVIFN